MSIALVPQFGWPPYLQTKLAAAYLGVSRFRIYRLVARGELKAVARKGRVLVFARAALDAFLLGNTTPSATPTASTLRVVDDTDNA